MKEEFKKVICFRKLYVKFNSNLINNMGWEKFSKETHLTYFRNKTVSTEGIIPIFLYHVICKGSFSLFHRLPVLNGI